jgi:hypothetical protein
VPPLVVKLQLADLRHTGRVVGRLSGVGTLGAITATFVTGFVLVAALPTTVIMLSLAGVLAVFGLGMTVVAGISSGRSSAALASIGLLGAGLTAFAPHPCDVETAYHCARITTDPTRPGGRVLWLNSGRHSYVDITDPWHLEFEYTKWIGALVDELAPADVLHVGGGGFTLPAYVAATRPGSDNLVLEVDEVLVELDSARLGLRTGPSLRVVIGDGRVSLAGQPTASRDLVIGDAFGHLVVPWHLTTREFASDVRRVLRTDGVYALNVIDGPQGRFARAEAATLVAVFRYTVVIAPPAALDGQDGANFVIVGSQIPLPVAAVAARLAGLAASPGLRDGVEFASGARILTDDDAPVDQLLNGL